MTSSTRLFWNPLQSISARAIDHVQFEDLRKALGSYGRIPAPAEVAAVFARLRGTVTFFEQRQRFVKWQHLCDRQAAASRR